MAETRVSREEFEAWNERMVQEFDPGEYHNHPSPAVRFIERRRVDELLRLLQARSSDRVLEVGVGAGNILERVSSRSRVGVDISDYILGRARERLGDGVELLKADAEALPFEDASFDRVYCSEVLEHVIDPAAVIREIRRVLRPGGRAVISVPNEGLINQLKGVVLRVGPLARILLRTDSGGYTSVENMEDHWHLHAFDRKLLHQVVGDSFRVAEVRAVPSRALPLRYVALLLPG